MRFLSPIFLATSKERAVAMKFATRVLWIVHLLDDSMCVDVNYFKSITQVKGEHEFLFAPYSTAFTVRSVSWRKKPSKLNPHVIVLNAMPNSATNSKNLPLSPWN
jgi:hypothetical protein